MATLKELLSGLDSNSKTVEKTASVVSKDTTQEVDAILKQIGTTDDELTIEKTAHNPGGDKPMSLFEALNKSWEENEEAAAVVEKTAAAVSDDESQEEIEKIASVINERTDILGELAADYFNEIAAEQFEKIAAHMGIAPDESMDDKGKATGMFGEVGDARVATNRPADSEKQISIAPQYYSLDEGSNALVGLCIKKKILEKSMGGK